MKLLSSTHDLVQRLMEKMDRKIEALTEECRDADIIHKNKLQALQEQLEENLNLFTALKDRLDNVSRGAVTIGSKLQTADNLRERALESKELIECFTALNSPNVPSDSKALLKYFLEWKPQMENYRIKRHNIKLNLNQSRSFSTKESEEKYAVSQLCA